MESSGFTEFTEKSAACLGNSGGNASCRGEKCWMFDPVTIWGFCCWWFSKYVSSPPCFLIVEKSLIKGLAIKFLNLIFVLRFSFYPAPLLSRLIAVMECISGWSFISFLPGIYNSMNTCVFVWVLAFKVSRTNLCIRQQRRDCAASLSLIKSLFPSLLLNILGVFRIKIQWLFLIFFFSLKTHWTFPFQENT